MTTDHTNGDPPHEPGCNCGESNECPTYAPGVPTLTPEAPPAREPGWYWVKWYAEQVDWTATMADGDGVKDPNIGKWRPLSAVHEWGPRIDPPDAKSPEPPPLPDRLRKLEEFRAAVVKALEVLNG